MTIHQLNIKKTTSPITVNASIYSPVILQDHEAITASGSGGHTISRHVNQNVTNLLSRFPRLRVASTFTNLSMAELSATEWFKLFLKEFIQWYNEPTRTEVKFSREVDLTQKIGIYIKQDSPSNIIDATKINLVMKVAPFNGMPHFILTAFPIEG